MKKDYDFDCLYKIYPKTGMGKAAGIARLRATIKNDEDYISLCKAIENYSRICIEEEVELKYIKGWPSFCCKWRNFVPDNEPTNEDGDHKILQRIWNENCGDLPEALLVIGSRKAQSIARWKEWPKEEIWIEVVQRIAASKFCNGKNDMGWIADFDFLIKPETHVKVNEGKYDDRVKNNYMAFRP